MMLSNLNLSSLPECNFEVRYVDSVLLNPCAEYQRLLRMGKVAKIAANFMGSVPRGKSTASVRSTTSTRATVQHFTGKC